MKKSAGWEPATTYTLPSGIVLSADAMEPTVVTSTVAARNVSARGRLSPDEVCEYFGYDRFIGARNVTRKGVIVRGIGGLIASPPPPAGQWFGYHTNKKWRCERIPAACSPRATSVLTRRT